MSDPFSAARTSGRILLALLGIRIVDSLIGFAIPYVVRSRVLFQIFSIQRGLQILLLIACVIVHIVFVRAYFVALNATGRATKHSPNFTIAGWFIPLANFVFPFLSVKQAFEAQRRSFAIAVLWWISYVCMTINNAANFRVPFIHFVLALATFGLWAVMTKSLLDATTTPIAPAFGANPGFGAAPPPNVAFPAEWGWAFIHHAQARLKALGYYYRDKAAGPSFKIVVDLNVVPPDQIAHAAQAVGYAGNTTFRLGAHETLNVESLPPDFAANMRQKYESGVGTAGPHCAVVWKLTSAERAALALPPAPPHMEVYL